MSTKKVKVIDISINGVSLESTCRLDLGNSYALHLTDKKKTIALRGNVVWASLVESKKGHSGNVIPIYKVGMNFSDMSHEKEIDFLNFILENRMICMYKVPAATSENGSEIPKKNLGKAEHTHNFRGSIGYHEALGVTEHPTSRRVKETCLLAAGDASLTRLVVPRKILATTGKVVTLKAYAIAASKAGEVAVTVTLTAVPDAGVKVGIHPANVTKEVSRQPTNFCFSSRIVCAKSGTWPVKWTAKINSSKESKTANNVQTGITRVVCRNG